MAKGKNKSSRAVAVWHGFNSFVDGPTSVAPVGFILLLWYKHLLKDADQPASPSNMTSTAIGLWVLALVFSVLRIKSNSGTANTAAAKAPRKNQDLLLKECDLIEAAKLKGVTIEDNDDLNDIIQKLNTCVCGSDNPAAITYIKNESTLNNGIENLFNGTLGFALPSVFGLLFDASVQNFGELTSEYGHNIGEIITAAIIVISVINGVLNAVDKAHQRNANRDAKQRKEMHREFRKLLHDGMQGSSSIGGGDEESHDEPKLRPLHKEPVTDRSALLGNG